MRNAILRQLTANDLTMPVKFSTLTFLVLLISLLITIKNATSQVGKDPLSRSLFDRTHETDDIIKSRGYECENHKVTTPDNYILTLHRLINPLRKSRGKPVLIVHGRLSSDIVFVMQSGRGDLDNGNLKVPIENEMAFALSRRGYDVWLGNSRGSTYSLKHVYLTCDMVDYWKFTQDEKAFYDTPAMIDYVLHHSRHKSLAYVGWSLGSQSLLSLMTTTTKYNELVKPALLMAPITQSTLSKNVIKRIFDSFPILLPLFASFPGPFATGEQTQPIITPASLVCLVPIIRSLCTVAWFLIAGYDLPNLDSSRLNVYATHLPGGASTWEFSQTYQNNGGRGRFNFYNREKNIQKYGTEEAPQIYFANITSKNIILIRSVDDIYADPADIEVFKQNITTTLLAEYVVPAANFTHLDFVLGKTAGRLVNKYILDKLKEYA